jgi:hypothetical protein
MSRPNRWTVYGAGVALTAVFAVLSRIHDLRENVGLFLAVLAVAFAAYGVSLTALGGGSGTVRSRRFLLFVFGVAAISRAVLIPSLPEMSTDVFRYVWEGRVITHGFNPYSHSPDAPELEFLRDRYYDDINHKNLATIYPPVSQAVFALAAWVRPGPYALKLILALFDMGAVLMIFAILKLRSLDPAAIAVYAWNPLVIFESGHSGHVEPVGIFFLVLGLWLIARGRKLTGFAAMGMSLLAKYVSAVFLPFFLARKRYAPWVAVTALVAVAGFLPFLGAGEGLFSSLKLYLTQWRFNGLAYRLSYSVLGNEQVARGLLASATAAVVVYNALRQTDVVRYGYVVIGAGLLLAPVLYPWYAVWIVPFLCFYRNRAWILFTGLVCVSYWVWEIFPVTGRWELPWHLYALEYVPFYALLTYDALRGRRRRMEGAR